MIESRGREYQSQNLVIGGGVAGIVAALELLEGGQSVTLVDRDSPERFGGLARWAFGGMAFTGTPEQRRYRISDSPELMLTDWLRFGELDADDEWSRAWARCYVEESKPLVYDWLKMLGLKFMPAVNWVERGSAVKGNSVPRYHLLWGTGLELVETLIERLQHHANRNRLTLLHRHRAVGLDGSGGAVTGCRGVDESTGAEFVVSAERTIVATGGINGAVEQVRQHWPSRWGPPPEVILNGAHPFSDGQIHQAVAGHGGRLSNLESMWNYAAGIPHPEPHFEGHGLSLIPCKTGLWLTPDGEPVGPEPMVTGFDTHEMCRQVARYPYTWQVLNWKIASREMAISGSEHNPRIVRHQLLRFLYETLTGSDRLVRQMVGQCRDFVVASDVGQLVERMNALAGKRRLDADTLGSQLEHYDRTISDEALRRSDPAMRRIAELLRWRSDALRTCRWQAIGERRAGPLLAIRLRFISRKSLGGIRTDLQCRVVADNGEILPGLYAVGEAAGFGGGGACGKRSLEGTFLSGCILTARKAAASILGRAAG
jgi:predicted oxidoreductase